MEREEFDNWEKERMKGERLERNKGKEDKDFNGEGIDEGIR